MYESGPEIMTNSDPAPRFDDANQHVPGEFINMYSPVDHISVGLGETKGFTSRHKCGTSRLIFAFNFSAGDTSSCTWYKSQCNFLSSFHKFCMCTTVVTVKICLVPGQKS
jgi:hypothetical protein